MNIAKLAEDNIRQYGEYVYLVFEDREYTNVEIGFQSRKLGNCLKSLGVQKGDRVIIQLPNSPEVIWSFQAIFKIGAIAVPINYLIGAEELSYIYNDSAANTVITSSDFIDKANTASLSSPAIQNIIVVDQDRFDAVSYRKLMQQSSDILETVETEDDDLACLLYTAGTTGRPKGVMLTHHALYSNAKMQFETLNPSRDNINITSLPLSHSYGVASMNSSFLSGVKTVLLKWFNLEQFFKAVEKYRPTVTTGVPTMYAYMLLYPDADKYDVSSLKFWISGSAPLDSHIMRGIKEKFNGFVVEGWGLTEAGGNNAINALTSISKPGAIGIPMKGVEMKIVDESGNELIQGKIGEIAIKGPMLMKGYWNMPAETAEVLRDGWLYTGDIGYVDEEGYYYITERKKDMIIKAGENVYPKEIENVLLLHPMVAECSVVGIPDQVYGEDIKAFVVLKDNETVTEEELILHCKKTLGNFKLPKVIQIIDSLPRNVMGKILKKELRKLG